MVSTLILWIIFIAALVLFTIRVIYLIKLLKLGRPENRYENIPKRIWLVITNVLAQKRFWKRELLGSIPHILVFWGFLVFFLETATLLLEGLIPGISFAFLKENRYWGTLVDSFAVLVLISLCVLAIRRFIVRPHGLENTPQAVLILVIIAYLMISYLFIGASKVALAYMKNQPIHLGIVSSAIGKLLYNLNFSPRATNFLHTFSWWSHILVILGFLVFIPYSKHLHLLMAPFSVFFSKISPKGDLTLVSKEDGSYGANYVRDFSWRELFNGYACAECGRCERVCPAQTCGEPLSPKMIVHGVKQHLLDEGKILLKKDKQKENLSKKLIGDIITEEELWGCMTCIACMEACPVMNEHIPLIVKMRQHLVGEGAVDTRVQKVLENISRYGNSFGQSDRARAKWTQGLEFKIKDARKEEVEYLWFVGDYASYDPRVQEVTKTVARLFHKSGIDFGILYEGERNSGNDIRRIGEEGLFQELKERNSELIAKSKAKKIITTDPHTFNTLKNEYNFNQNGSIPVLHYTQLLYELISANKLQLRKKLNLKVTYHDPCYLGRYNDIYDEPREIIRATGAQLIEMPRSRSNSFCCGAGGGKIWIEVKNVKERPAENRIREALSLSKPVEIFAVACPKDFVMFQDAVKTTANEGKIKVKDIAELLWEAIE